MAYRVGDYLEEHPLSAKRQKAIDNMTEAEALGYVLEAAESWDSEVNEYIFQELSKEEQKGYALANVKHEKAMEIVQRMLTERKGEDPTSPDFPEHAKLTKVATEVNAVLEFINEALDRDREPIPDELVYAHWGVDYDKIKQEREQMLQTYRTEDNTDG